MSLDKAIKYGKEKRKPYRRSKVFDQSCRNHGSCPWCEGNRTHSDRKRRLVADEKLHKWELDLLEDKMSMDDFDVNIGSFVVIDGVDYCVATNTDDDGYFFATDDDGFEHSFHWDQVDFVR